jgi:hypothetical protein
MTNDREVAGILARVRALLRSGDVGSSLVRESGRIGAPIPVLAPDSQLHSWFVPVTIGNGLAAFFQLLPDLTMMRYSSFQKRDDSMEGCPSAELWIDAETVRRRAQERARPGETVGQPFLTYDRAPSRLVWAVPLTSPDGTTRTLHVAGRAVWEAVTTDKGIDSYGGGSPR